MGPARARPDTDKTSAERPSARVGDADGPSSGAPVGGGAELTDRPTRKRGARQKKTRPQPGSRRGALNIAALRPSAARRLVAPASVVGGPAERESHGVRRATARCQYPASR